MRFLVPNALTHVSVFLKPIPYTITLYSHGKESVIMKYKNLLMIIIPLLFLGLGSAPLLAQGQEDGEEEESPIQTRPVPYTSQDPTSRGRDTMMKGREDVTQQKAQELQQAPAMKGKLKVTPDNAAGGAQTAPQSPQR